MLSTLAHCCAGYWCGGAVRAAADLSTMFALVPAPGSPLGYLLTALAARS
ncbi:hypothetical protein I551_8539 [Mycobacterium ulcerans str. Harvey]|uniref:Uncharacterized protein n=1 Tax=Mycobacterium ulcerans str. Harvey TaxID=1299332 RepID=A0ABN0RAI7_MYCUL|nr:hypothetical protein I551_8539 [Mycobacterium ulcerans str. Harvey]